MAGRDLRLVLPLAALFAVFFVAPLCVPVALSLSTGAGLHGWTLGHYIKFFTDPFNYSILWSTILLGVKATLLCLVFGYPIAWIASRASARWQAVLLFLVFCQAARGLWCERFPGSAFGGVRACSIRSRSGFI